MIKSPNVSKEKCEGCNKFILIHNRIVSCNTCNKLVHSQCANNIFQYNHVTDCWQCNVCISCTPTRYNPFSTISHDRHDPVHMDEFEDVIEVKKILDSCQTYNPKSLNYLMNLHNDENEKLTTLFNNIDGNASNFDTFVTGITQYNHPFLLLVLLRLMLILTAKICTRYRDMFLNITTRCVENQRVVVLPSILKRISSLHA